MTEEKSQQALVAHTPRQFSLVPNTLGEAMELARMIAGSEFAPKDYKEKPANVMIAIQMGQDVGIPPMQALQTIAVINGRPSIYGDGALAVVMPLLERFKETIEGEGDKRTATCIAKRKGWPDETVQTFSVADAKKAGLWGKSGPWTNYSDRMLQMRARGFALRDVAPDRLMGLITAEEAQDYIDVEVVRPGSSVDAVAPAASVQIFERVSEPHRATIGKAFTELQMSEAAQLMKLNEYFVADKDPEEQAVALIEWMKDEYAKRKFGQPRGPKPTGDNGRKAKPEPKATKPEEKPVGSGSTVAAKAEEAKPAEPETVDAPDASEIF